MHYLVHELPVVHMHASQASNITNELPGPVCVAHQHHSSVQLCKRGKTIKMTLNKFEMKVVTMMIMMIDDFKNTNDEHNSSYDNGDVDNNSDNDNDEN